MNNLEEQIYKFVEYLNSTHKGNNYTAVIISPKWVRIEDHYNNHESAYCFIAQQDMNSNKTLGPIKIGDIHKPASWKAPAKHARGSVFNDKTWTCAGPYGIKYLR